MQILWADRPREEDDGVWVLSGRVSQILGWFLLGTGRRDVNWGVVKTN